MSKPSLKQPNIHASSKTLHASTTFGPKQNQETVYKMCKKIAQLTKVVYYLNTKNEDFGTEIESLVVAYEDEITQCLKEAQAKVEEKINKIVEKDEKIKQQSEIIKSHQTTIDQLQNQTNDYKSNEAALYKSITQLKKQVNDLTSEKDQISTLAKSSQHDLTKKIQEYDTTLKIKEKELLDKEMEIRKQDLELEQITSERESVISRRVSMYEQKIEEHQNANSSVLERNLSLTSLVKQKDDEYKKMEISYKEQIEKLKTKYEEEVAAANEKVDLLTSSLTEQEESIKESLSETIRGFERDVAKLKYNNKYLEDNLEATTTNYRNAEAEANNYKKSSEEKYNELVLLNFNLKVLGEKNEALQKEAVTTKTQLETTDLNLTRVSAMLKKSSAENELHLSNISRLKEDHQVLRMERDSLHKNLSENRKKLETALHLIDDLQVQGKIARTTITDKTIKIEQLQAKLLHLAEEAEIVKNTELLSLQHELTTKHENEIIHIRENVAKDNANLVKKFEKQIEILNLKYKTDFEAYQVVKENLKGELAQASSDIVQLNYLLSCEVQKYNDCLTNYNNLMSDALKTQEELAKAKLNIESLEQDQSLLYQKLVGVETEVREEMKNKYDLIITNVKKELNQLHETKLNQITGEMTENYTREIAELNKTHQAKKAEEVFVLNAVFNEKIAIAAKEKKDLRDAVAKLEMEKEHLNKRIEELIEKHHTDMREKLETVNQQHAQEKRDIEEDIKVQITKIKVTAGVAREKMEVDHLLFIEELKKGHVEEIKKLEQSNLLLIEEKTQALNEKKAEEIGQIRKDHSIAIELLNQTHAQAVEKVMAEAETRQSQALEQWQEKSNDIAKNKESEIGRLRKLIEESMNEKAILEEKIEKMNEIIEGLKFDIMGKTKSIQNLREKLVLAVKATEEELQKKHKLELENVQRDNLKEAKIMLNDFQQGQNYLKNQIAHQVKLLEESEHKYLNREAREVDLKKIESLEEEIKLRSKRIDSLMEELNFYRLELNNREANFNKIFNKSPIIGVLQPNAASQKTIKKSGGADSMSRLPPLFTSSSHSLKSTGSTSAVLLSTPHISPSAK